MVKRRAFTKIATTALADPLLQQLRVPYKQFGFAALGAPARAVGTLQRSSHAVNHVFPLLESTAKLSCELDRRAEFINESSQHWIINGGVRILGAL
jgi:hypothetical protein